MTDYIIEVDGNEICEYVDDARDAVVVITNRASVLERKYRMPVEIRKALRELKRISGW